MNIQYERIQAICQQLKLHAISSEWPTIAGHMAKEESSLADFLEALLQAELDAKEARTQSALLKFAGLPSI